ncbi:hypothetical protein A8924_2932 [Saccharopolyspora erythraea NRRL 2338]|uniref:Uncharacterized protein n=1 Tax=Saccharopolyspora erythraea TaxID=1836 RepID=A0ABN1E318_SACER|nr:hypothetical protein [Saccharopolyspora erythraea]EQD84119.1 hypothetical protein N599_21685 [Saccharopolyspora erythraea D]PFG95589.1 hypothetical protein A8924_2932 [Saccharopolyspora erythraea NRRL 2338]QRK92203.1 hypothetical protein JQX30_13170 [Saccharopolyspora erythraea]
MELGEGQSVVDRHGCMGLGTAGVGADAQGVDGTVVARRGAEVAVAGQMAPGRGAAGLELILSHLPPCPGQVTYS